MFILPFTGNSSKAVNVEKSYGIIFRKLNTQYSKEYVHCSLASYNWTVYTLVLDFLSLLQFLFNHDFWYIINSYCIAIIYCSLFILLYECIIFQMDMYWPIQIHICRVTNTHRFHYYRVLFLNYYCIKHELLSLKMK